MEETQKLFIPTGVKGKTEIAKGFGMRELRRFIISFFALSFLNFCVYLVTQSVNISLVIFMLSVIGPIMFLIKDETNVSSFDMARFFVRFLRSQKKYPYKYHDHWK